MPNRIEYNINAPNGVFLDSVKAKSKISAFRKSNGYEKIWGQKTNNVNITAPEEVRDANDLWNNKRAKYKEVTAK